MISVPQSLTQTSNSDILVDAVYFVVRVLRNALRGYKETRVSREAPYEAQQSARFAIAEIEATECTRIVDVDSRRLEEYISTLEAYVIARTMKSQPSLETSAKEALEDMRSFRM